MMGDKDKGTKKVLGEGWLSIKFFNTDGAVSFEVIGRGRAKADKISDSFIESKAGTDEAVIVFKFGDRDVALDTRHYSAVTIVDLADDSAMQLMLHRRTEAIQRFAQPMPGLPGANH